MAKINNNYALFNNDLKPKRTDSKRSTKKGGLGKTAKESFMNLFSKELDAAQELGELEELEELEEVGPESEIEQLLQEVGLQGKRLKKRPLLEEFQNYRRVVKKLISLVVSSSQSIERRTMWNKFRKEKVTKVHLTIVDRELLELSNLFFKNQKNVLEIAAKIDKIEGILIDLKS